MSDSEARLRERARRDALRLTPEFSDALHARITCAIGSMESERRRSAGAARDGNQSRPFILRHPWLFPVGLTAGIALAVAPGLLRLMRSTAPATIAIAPDKPTEIVGGDTSMPVATVPSIDQAAQQVNARVRDVVRTAMVQQQWIGLDHDMRLATRYLVDQVPLRAAWKSDQGSE